MDPLALVNDFNIHLVTGEPSTLAIMLGQWNAEKRAYTNAMAVHSIFEGFGYRLHLHSDKSLSEAVVAASLVPEPSRQGAPVTPYSLANYLTWKLYTYSNVSREVMANQYEAFMHVQFWGTTDYLPEQVDLALAVDYKEYEGDPFPTSFVAASLALRNKYPKSLVKRIGEPVSSEEFLGRLP